MFINGIITVTTIAYYSIKIRSQWQATDSDDIKLSLDQNKGKITKKKLGFSLALRSNS